MSIAQPLPTCLIGCITGDRRLEANGGDALIVNADTPFLFIERPKEFGGKLFAVTHLQKKSRLGFLLMQHEKWWHFCFHTWLTFKFQQYDEVEKNWIPKTERVFYWRIGWSRWDAGDSIYVSGWSVDIEFTDIGHLKFTIPFGTWYGPGLRWD